MNKMKNVLKVDFIKSLIIMDRTFASLCVNTNSVEYARLQEVRRDYPNYKVITRTIKKNPDKETYKGLTYEYMEDYILRHETDETALDVIKEFNELRNISKCHKQGKRYPTIKKWFLNKYPEVAEFGVAA